MAAASAPAPAAPHAGVRLYIAQIPKNADEAMLKPVFEPYGEVVAVQVLRDKGSGQSKGSCFCTFRTQQQAESCIQQLNNRCTLPPSTNPLQVRYAEGEVLNPGTSKLFIGQLPKTITEPEIRALFESFGEIVDLTILKDVNGTPRGCGFLRYPNRECCNSAIGALDGKHMFPSTGLALSVRYAETPQEKEMKKRVNVKSHGGNGGNGGNGGGYGNMHGFQMGMHPSRGGPGGYGMAPGMGGYGGMGNMGGGYGNGVGMGMGGMGMGMGMGGYGSAPVMGGGNGGSNGGGNGGNGGAKQPEGPPGANLFVYHVPPEWRDDELRAAFAPLGNVVSARVFIDKNTGMPKGFGFVSYDNPISASNAIQAMNGCQVGSRRLAVSLKKAGQDGNNPGGARHSPY